MPTSKISPNFDTQIDTIAAELNDIGQEPVEISQRPWMLPAPNGWDGNPFSITGIASAYDRDDLNSDYTTAVVTAGQENGGRVVDRMVSKTQVDYLAIMERAFRARHASPIRCMTHSAIRHKGHGGPTGVIKTVRDYITDILAHGYAS